MEVRLLFIEISFLYNLSITKYKSFNLITFATPDSTSIESLFVVRRQDRYANSPNEWWCFLRINLEPFKPYMFVDSIGLSPGYYYYYTFFTKLTNGILIKDTLKVKSPAPPQLVSINPVPGITDGRSFKFVFNARIDSVSFVNGTRIFSYNYLDTIYYTKRDIKIRKDSIFVSLTPIPRSNDNLVFHIRSDSVSDIFGNKIDGNWNTLEDGSPDDDVCINYKISPLGDFNLDLEVNSFDFAIFREAFLNDDIYFETGPYYGNLPDIYCIPDGTMDYKDFNSFCIIWKWFLNHRKIFVEKNDGLNLFIENKRIVSNLDGYLEIASKSEVMIDKEILLKGSKYDTIVYLIDMNKGERIKFDGEIISYRLIDKNGNLAGSGNNLISERDSLIFDIMGRKNYKVNNGVYFIIKNRALRKTIRIR